MMPFTEKQAIDQLKKSLGPCGLSVLDKPEVSYVIECRDDIQANNLVTWISDNNPSFHVARSDSTVRLVPSNDRELEDLLMYIKDNPRALRVSLSQKETKWFGLD